MNPNIPLIIGAVLGVVTLLQLRKQLTEQGAEFTRAVRRIKNPPYPVTPEEILSEGQEELRRSSFTSFAAVTAVKQFKLIWMKYPDEPELQEMSRSIRRTIYRYIIQLLLVFFFTVAGLVAAYAI
jgi:hypothetical protein